MKSGLLWYDNSPAPLAQKIATASKRWREKFGNAPNCAFINPTDVSIHDLAALSAATGMSVDVKNTIIKNHIWLGVDETLQVQEAPTEQELNQQYLAVNDWQRTDISGVDAWEDPLGGGAYEFENALAIQSARDVRDNSETPLGELYGGE